MDENKTTIFWVLNKMNSKQAKKLCYVIKFPDSLDYQNNFDCGDYWDF